MQRPLKLFVNYRRQDHPHFVESIYIWLILRYGRENVFMDSASLPPFTEFEGFIRNKIFESDVVISIIGPQWLDTLLAREASGEKDFVRMELELALANNKLVAPIVILTGSVPPIQRVPATLRPIFETWQAAELRDSRAVIEKIHAIFGALEAEMNRRRVQFSLPKTATHLSQAGRQATRDQDIHTLYRQMLEARNKGDWALVLAYAAEIGESDLSLPRTVAEDARIIAEEGRHKLREQADLDRRAEVASYLYAFAKTRYEAGYVDAELGELLQSVWAILPGYDPDGIGSHTPNRRRRRFGFMRAQPNARQPLVNAEAIADILGGPFLWCRVEGGAFKMGSDPRLDPAHFPDELPQQALTLPTFLMGKFAVTNAQFDRFVQAHDGYGDPRWWEGLELSANSPILTAPDPCGFAGDDLPRETVSWYEAVAFVRWLSYQLGGAYEWRALDRWVVRLPREDEWEMAARGPDGRIFPWGDRFDPTLCNTIESDRWCTEPVTAYQNTPAPFGLVSASGNVQEWCFSDWTQPFRPATHNRLRLAADKVVRGGSWQHSAIHARTASRGYFAPDTRASTLGFRLMTALDDALG